MPDVFGSMAGNVKTGDLTALDPSLRDQIAWFLANQAGNLGADPQQQRYVADKVGGVLDFIPGVGDVLGVDDTSRSLDEGNYGQAALNGAALAMGLIPGAGDLAAKGAKSIFGSMAPIARPAQESSGLFDLGARYAPRDLGVERFRPKKVPERTTELLARPDVREGMLAGVERGRPVADWYETGPLRKSFEDYFGPEQGLKQFDQLIDAVSASSPRSDVGTNVRNASYYYGMAQPAPGRNSIPSIDDLPERNPAPYGHLAQNLHRMNAAKTVFPGGGGLDFKQNAKPISFAANLKGDPSVATIDTHAFRAPAMTGADPRFLERSFLNEKGAVPRNIQEEVASGRVPMEEALNRGAFWASKPLPTEYAAFEDFYKGMGQELGMTPAEAQAASWVGHGATTGLESAPKSFMDFVEERILLTARKLGKDPKDVWRDAMTGKAPLLSLGGLALGASALRQQSGDRS